MATNRGDMPGRSARGMALRALGLRVVDLSDISDATGGHLTAATSPTATAPIRGLRGQMDAGAIQ